MVFSDNPVLHRRRPFPSGYLRQVYGWAKKDAQLGFAYHELFRSRDFLLLLGAPFGIAALLIISAMIGNMLAGIGLFAAGYLAYALDIIRKSSERRLYPILLVAVPLHHLALFLGFWSTILSVHMWKIYIGMRR